MKVFAAKFNPMIEESAYCTISLHETRKGAEMAIEFHKEETKKKEMEHSSWYDNSKRKWDRWFDWSIEEMEVKP